MARLLTNRRTAVAAGVVLGGALAIAGCGGSGAGGSAGAAYLRETVGRPLFPDLWEIRSQL